MNSLNKKQKAEYLKLDFIAGELSVVEQNEFSKHLTKYFSVQISQFLDLQT